MTAIKSRRGPSSPRVVLMDGAMKPGAKILVSGGSRCNVTNAVVTERDFWGGRRTLVRRILRTFPVAETVRFFDALGVALREEEAGKLFPVSNRSRDVVAALLHAVEISGAELHAATRVTAVESTDAGFEVFTSRGAVTAKAVVLATGGLSLPKTGSDGLGYTIARALGHQIVPPTPGLAPLVLDQTDPYAINRELSGVSHVVELTVWTENSVFVRLDGSLLWTHFGVSGPVVLNASRHFARAQLENRHTRVTANFYPGQSFATLEQTWINSSRSRPTATVRSMLGTTLPDAVAHSVVRGLSLDADRLLADLSREDRRRLVHALVEWPLPVLDTRGYTYAEVTAGGVPLSEIDPSTMESRVCRGLFLVGEILDVDGRLGGFNFQWAWATGKVAGAALAARNW
jgi:predicted Rossmann fold flavoprotein